MLYHSSPLHQARENVIVYLYSRAGADGRVGALTEKSSLHGEVCVGWLGGQVDVGLDGCPVFAVKSCIERDCQSSYETAATTSLCDSSGQCCDIHCTYLAILTTPGAQV